LTAARQGARGERLRHFKSELLGQVVSLVVIEVDQQCRRLVLSQRLAEQHQRQEILAELTEGETRMGIVCNLVPFGAFVDLGGVDGLIHIFELDWKHVDHPREVLCVGEEVEVYILKVDRQRERIGLSRKRLLSDPWPSVADELQVGQTIQGTVTNVTRFGIFVDLGKGVEGLVHVSEIPEEKADWSSLKPDSLLSVCVKKIDPWRRRIALGWENIPVKVHDEDAEAVPLPVDVVD
jgi:small subunit ribosomal protein S1